MKVLSSLALCSALLLAACAAGGQKDAVPTANAATPSMRIRWRATIVTSETATDAERGIPAVVPPGRWALRRRYWTVLARVAPSGSSPFFITRHRLPGGLASGP